MTDKKHTQYVYRPAKVDLADESIMVVDAEYGLVICSSEWADDLDLDDPEHDNLPELNAALIAEAFNVAHETGKTPRQLADSNAELVAAMDAINGMACYASEEDTASRYEMLLKIGETARAAKAKAEG